MIDRVTIARRLRESRAAAGLTQQQVADAAKLNKQQLSDYERGRREPSASMLGKLAAALGVSADSLLRSDSTP